MHFYSGFLLRGEAAFFEPYLKTGATNVAGFSYGAVKAFEYVSAARERVDTLQLFSPAFFLGRDTRFKRMQLRGFSRDPDAYRRAFLQSCFSPYPVQAVAPSDDGADDLEKLLDFPWPVEALESIKERGVAIEVYVGEKDAVIDPVAALHHFKPFATTYFIKGANHFLQGERI